MQRMPVPPARPGSWDDILHAAGPRDRVLLSHEIADAPGAGERIGQRAIGVVYRPEREGLGDYADTALPDRYDALLYIDEAEALHPLRMRPRQDGEPSETFPVGM